MKRLALGVAMCIASWCSLAAAGNTKFDSMFSELRHDFGNVPKGAEGIRHDFVLTNTTDSMVRIRGLSRTCGCTQVTLNDRVVLDENIRVTSEGATIEPGEQARITVTLDTKKFQGSKSADITVSFDKPSRSDVRLTVTSFIRPGVVFNPGSVQFGIVAPGQTATRDIDIEYAGKAEWQISAVTSENSNLDVTFAESYRKPEGVGYKITVALKSTAPVGSFRDTLTVETNDAQAPRVPITVTGEVQADLVITPASLAFGNIKPGASVTRQVLIRGKKPFKLTKVEGTDQRFSFEASNTAQAVQKVAINFTAGDETGSIEATFRIQTDIGDDAVAELKATGQVVVE